MSQLRAGGAATFPFRKLGRNPPELQVRSFLACSCGFRRTLCKINRAARSAEGLAQQIIEPVGKGMYQT